MWYRALLISVFVGVGKAECPNACSGHGTCIQYDMCSCYRNWQANDCSQRTCPFGYAHVDSPVGDLDMSGGVLTGPDTTVVAGSEVYPMGTTEKYPDAQDNEAHFYMECSNKGLCNRVTGECECFAGYDGTACERLSCPGGHGGSSEQCSGHGTCHSIASLTEKYSYSRLPLEMRSGALGTQTYYGLWDKNASRGCHCDPPYVGPDCGSRACKVGIDPLFSGYATLNEALIALACQDIGLTPDPDSTFTILFTDSFGQTYRSSKLSITASASDVEAALEAMPNGVIPDAVVEDYLSETYSDVFGAWMIKFPENPGARAGLEVDTSEIDCEPPFPIPPFHPMFQGFPKSGPVNQPNVGFRKVGSNYEEFTYHKTDIAFAKKGHRLIYTKTVLQTASLEGSSPALFPAASGLTLIKVEDAVYVVEHAGAIGPADGLGFALLNVPYEGSDVNGDTDRSTTFLQGIGAAEVTFEQSTPQPWGGVDNHLSGIFFTTHNGDGIAIDSNADVDNDSVNEANGFFTAGEYYLLEFQTTLFSPVSYPAPFSNADEYCIIYIGSDVSGIDQFSESSTPGARIVGPELVTRTDTYTFSSAEFIGVEVTDLASKNCPLGYKNEQFFTTEPPVCADDYVQTQCEIGMTGFGCSWDGSSCTGTWTTNAMTACSDITETVSAIDGSTQPHCETAAGCPSQVNYCPTVYDCVWADQVHPECSDYTSQTNCETLGGFGCTWDGATCSGTWTHQTYWDFTTCDAITTTTSAIDGSTQPHCETAAGCPADYNNCPTAYGCSWADQVHPECSDYTSPTDCEGLGDFGCTWDGATCSGTWTHQTYWDFTTCDAITTTTSAIDGSTQPHCETAAGCPADYNNCPTAYGCSWADQVHPECSDYTSPTDCEGLGGFGCTWDGATCTGTWTHQTHWDFTTCAAITPQTDCVDDNLGCPNQYYQCPTAYGCVWQSQQHDECSDFSVQSDCEGLGGFGCSWDGSTCSGTWDHSEYNSFTTCAAITPQVDCEDADGCPAQKLQCPTAYGCVWADAVNPECTDYTSQADCEGLGAFGCTWDGFTCSGTWLHSTYDNGVTCADITATGCNDADSCPAQKLQCPTAYNCVWTDASNPECSDYTTASDCVGLGGFGCTWDGAVCTGTWDRNEWFSFSDCADPTSVDQCPTAYGCTWTPDPVCADYTGAGQAACDSLGAFGCSWDGLACTGTWVDVPGYDCATDGVDATSCATQYGCNWDGAACTDPGSFTHPTLANCAGTYSAPTITYDDCSGTYQAPTVSYDTCSGSYSATVIYDECSGTYQAPTVSYDDCSGTYVAPSVVYDDCSGTYSPPTVSYDSCSGTYSAPTVSYDTCSGTYSAATVSYDTCSGTYNAPTVSYDTCSGTYAAPTVSYDTCSGTYAAPPVSYDTCSGTYNPPPVVTSNDAQEMHEAGFLPMQISTFHLERDNAVAPKYQSTHAAPGGAVLKSAFSRLTEQSSRGTTRAYQTAEANFKTANRVGALNSLDATVGSSVLSVADDSGNTWLPNEGQEILVGTERNVFHESVSMGGITYVTLENIFTGTGEGQGRSNLHFSTSELDHLSSLYGVVDGDVTPYQYVSECSGRGLCDGETGLCDCFDGYTNDNCDSVTIDAVRK